MITVEKGDLFEGAYNAISHGVNCKGVMGAGISHPFMVKYPDMYEDYKSKCISGYARPGGFDRYLYEGGLKAVFNLFSQDNPGADARKDWLLMSLLGASHDVVVNAVPADGSKFRFAMPLIGCGIGGLEFKDLYETLGILDVIFGEKIEYVVVYNDSNENQVLDFLAQSGVESTV